MGQDLEIETSLEIEAETYVNVPEDTVTPFL